MGYTGCWCMKSHFPKYVLESTNTNSAPLLCVMKKTQFWHPEANIVICICLHSGSLGWGLDFLLSHFA